MLRCALIYLFSRCSFDGDFPVNFKNKQTVIIPDTLIISIFKKNSKNDRPKPKDSREQ